MGLAAALMAASILASRFMGLIRDKVISYYHGASLESDIYFASFVIPDFINYLLAGGYFSITLIPLLAAAFEREEADGWRLFSTILTWAVTAITLMTALAMLFTPWLAKLAAPGFPPEAQVRLVYFLRIILPAQIFFLAGSCFSALLYLRKQFAAPALSPLLYNGGIILGGLTLADHGMEGFCWGVLLGSFLGNFLLPVLAAFAGTPDQRPKLGLRFRHKELKSFLLLALPLMLGQSIVVLDEQFLRVFGSMAAVGAVSWLNYGRRLMLVPVGVVAQAAGVASYPFLAQLAARGAFEEFNATLRLALTNTLAFLLPLAAWMAAAATPIVQLIFEQGRFSPESTAATALCLQLMLAGVFCWGLQQIVGRAFYAHKDTLTPAVSGTLVTALSIPVYFAATRALGGLGVALASTLAVAAYAWLLCLLWRRRYGADSLRGLGRSLLVCSAVSLAAGAPAYAAVRAVYFLAPPASLLTGALALTASGLVFTPCFLLLARRHPDQFAALLERLGRLPGLRRWLRSSKPCQ